MRTLFRPSSKALSHWVHTSLSFITLIYLDWLPGVALFLMCMSVLSLCTSVYYVCTWCPRRLEEEAESPRTVVSDSYGLPCGCWEFNLGPLEEQPALLVTEPSLQSCFLVFEIFILFFVCVWLYELCVHVYHVNADDPRRLRRELSPWESELRQLCVTFGCWEPNLHPLREQ